MPEPARPATIKDAKHGAKLSHERHAHGQTRRSLGAEPLQSCSPIAA